MKRFLLLPALLAMFQLQAQQIEEYRYWINDEPTGVTVIGTAPDVHVNLVSALVLPALTKDYNMITIQFKDTNETYSVPVSRIFTRNTGPVTGYEYWFDDDIANRSSGSITAGTIVDLTSNFGQCLSSGSHLFTIRFAGASGTWSVPLSRQFTTTGPADADGDGLCDLEDPCPLAVDGIANFNTSTCNCDAGYYQETTTIGANTVITGCTICPPGFFCPDGLVAVACPAGTFSSLSGQQACAACPVNTYNPNEGQTECLACAFGESSGLGATECTPDGGCTTYILELQSGGTAPNAVTYEVLDETGTATILSGNNPVPANSIGTLTLCLNDGCYQLRVTDNAGDGLAGYILRESGASGRRIIDNVYNMNDGASQIAGGEGFCLPLGSDRLIYTSCDKMDWKTGPCGGEYVYANDNALVTAEYGVNDANSGYQMWWFDPNGGYSFKRFQSHSTSNGLPASATRACGFKLNSWTGNQLAQGVLYNVKVRGRVNGTWLAWGPACRLMVDNAAAQCPRTKLMDIPGNQYLSCGATRPVATNAYVHARPVRRMSNSCNWINANRYQFRFRIVAENVNIVKTSASGQYWVNTNGLSCGKTYEVDVRASFDNGATWCDMGPAGLNDPAWGDVCLLTTANCVGGGNQNLGLQGTGVAGELRMYPNPNRGDQLFVNLTQVEEGVSTVNVDIYDGFGKRVAARTIAVQDGFVNTVLSLNGELATGLYVVNITAGSQVHTERLVIQP